MPWSTKQLKSVPIKAVYNTFQAYPDGDYGEIEIHHNFYGFKADIDNDDVLQVFCFV